MCFIRFSKVVFSAFSFLIFFFRREREIFFFVNMPSPERNRKVMRIIGQFLMKNERACDLSVFSVECSERDFSSSMRVSSIRERASSCLSLLKAFSADWRSSKVLERDVRVAIARGKTIQRTSVLMVRERKCKMFCIIDVMG